MAACCAMSRNGLLSANDSRARLILEAHSGTSGTKLLWTRRTGCVTSMIPRRGTVHLASPGCNAQTAVDAKHLYFRRFGRERPEIVTSIEERARAQNAKKAARKETRRQARAAGGERPPGEA